MTWWSACAGQAALSQNSSHDLSVDATLAFVAEDAEIALLAPRLSPTWEMKRKNERMNGDN